MITDINSEDDEVGEANHVSHTPGDLPPLIFYELRADGLLTPRGERKWRRYLLTEMPRNKLPMVNNTGQ